MSSEAKVAIVKALKSIDPETGRIGMPQVSGIDKCGSVTETILAWHLATDLFEMEHAKRNLTTISNNQKVATMLARYCMYLVANAPELLVDDTTWTMDVYQDMKAYMRKLPPQCCGMTQHASMADPIEEPTATRLGREVFNKLNNRVGADGDDGEVWKLLEDFWAKLLVFVAPSENVEGHAKALATSGGELITYLWAFCSHAGISRQPLEQPDEIGSEQP